MSTQPAEDPGRLVVAFNPVPSASRVAHHHATRFRLAVQALVVVIIGGLLWALTADAFELSTVMWMFGAWVVLFLVLFVIQNLRLHAARKDLLDGYCAPGRRTSPHRPWTRSAGRAWRPSRWVGRPSGRAPGSSSMLTMAVSGKSRCPGWIVRQQTSTPQSQQRRAAGCASSRQGLTPPTDVRCAAPLSVLESRTDIIRVDAEE